MNASLISGILTFAGGVFISLIAFGVIPLPKNSSTAEQTIRSWGTFMRIVGPLLSVWGIFLVAQEL